MQEGVLIQLYLSLLFYNIWKDKYFSKETESKKKITTTGRKVQLYDKTYFKI